MTYILRVRNVAQKVLWEQELSGQISDGHWENSRPNDHWRSWSSAEVVIDPENVGRNFYAQRESYNFTSKDLLDVVGERMVEAVRVLTGNADYSEPDMKADLKDLKSIIKERVQSVVPVPRQPKTYKAVIALDGYPREYECFVPTESDPKAVEYLQKQKREQAAYRLKRLEQKIAETRREIDDLEAQATLLRAELEPTSV